jgi:hypothetical protein
MRLSLTDREAEFMDVLWESDPSTVAAALEQPLQNALLAVSNSVRRLLNGATPVRRAQIEGRRQRPGQHDRRRQ